MGVGKGNVEILISTSLPCFSSRGVRAAAASGVPILHSDLERVFSTNLISPNTELREGKGPETFQSCIPVKHMFLEGGEFLQRRWKWVSQLP